MEEGEVDLSLRSAYGLLGISPKTPQEVVSDYFQIDFVSNSSFVRWTRLIFIRNASDILLFCDDDTDYFG